MKKILFALLLPSCSIDFAAPAALAELPSPEALQLPGLSTQELLPIYPEQIVAEPEIADRMIAAEDVFATYFGVQLSWVLEDCSSASPGICVEERPALSGGRVGWALDHWIRLTPSAPPYALVHELLHVLGRTNAHNPEPGTLFSEGGGRRITDFELDVLCSRIECAWRLTGIIE